MVEYSWYELLCFECKMPPSMCDFVSHDRVVKEPIGVSVWNSIPFSVKLLIKSKFQNKIKNVLLDVLQCEDYYISLHVY